jgi:hypothetical protein
MKKLIILFFALALPGGCSVNTSGNIDIDADDLQYFKDDRTGLCFAAVASRKSMSTDATGLGLTCVPCDSLKNVKVK